MFYHDLGITGEQKDRINFMRPSAIIAALPAVFFMKGNGLFKFLLIKKKNYQQKTKKHL